MYIQDPTAPLDTALGTASSHFERVGSFRYLIADDRWEWSDAVARMHGYQPGTVTPTTELILSHKHPEDKPAVAEIIDQVLRHGAPFSSRHRILDTDGNVRVVVVLGERLTEADGRVIGTTGFYIDITDASDADLTAQGVGQGRNHRGQPGGHQPGNRHSDVDLRGVGRAGIRRSGLALEGYERQTA